MRTFTAIAPDRLLLVVPGPILEDFTTEVARLAEVNRGMAAYYRDRAVGLASR